MINEAAIREWSKTIPWKSNAQVEQDLLISRCLVAIFSDDFLREQLAFRGGTALHKLYMQPQLRYSEDIDLVQISAGPIKPILFRLGEVLNFMPDRVIKQKRYNNTMLFRMESEMEPVVPLRLKIEINCFEHFSEMGWIKLPFELNSIWAKGKCEITTYHFAELMGTKLRALYQRKKGRDLFDLYMALTRTDIKEDDIIRCYRSYMDFVAGQPPTYKQFIRNMEEKMTEPMFLNDMQMLMRPDITFDPVKAYIIVHERLLERL